MKKLLLGMYILLNLFTFSMELTKEEKQWVKSKENEIIKVYFNQNIRNDIFTYKYDGATKLQGVYIDFFQWLSEETKINFTPEYADNQLLSRSLVDKSKETIYYKLIKTPERELENNYVDTFNSYNIVLISEKKIDENLEKELKGKKIGIIDDKSEQNLFQERYGMEGYIPIYVSSMEEGFEKLKSGEIDYSLGKTENLRGVNYNFHNLRKIERQNFFLGMAKEFPHMKTVVEKYQKKYEREKLDETLRRNKIIFYRQIIENNSDYLKIKEKYSSLKVLLQEEKYLLPLYYEKNGEFEGYLPDFYRSIGQILDIPVEFIRVTDRYNLPEHHIRAISAGESAGFKRLYPYYRVRPIIISKLKADYLIDFSDYKKYKIGVKNYLGYVNSSDSRVEGLVDIYSYDVAIEELLDGTIDYLVGDFRVLSGIMTNKYLRNRLKIAGEIAGSYDLYPEVASEHTELIKIMELISQPYVGEGHILKSHIDKPIILNPDYKRFIWGVIFFFSITGILLYFLYYSKKENLKKERMLNSLIESFEMANHYNDEDTGMHIIRVNRYAKFLAEQLGASRSFIKEIGKYSSLHDIGKLGITDSILKKPGKLTEEEMTEMKTHVEIGYELVKKMNVGKIAENIVRYHHERWDGKGYLIGIKGENIPLEARIVTLVDVYDALRQARVYKPAFSHNKAVEIIKEESGKAFDPKLVDLFLINHHTFQEIYKSNE